MKLLRKIIKLFIVNAAKATEVEILIYAKLHSAEQVNEIRATK